MKQTFLETQGDLKWLEEVHGCKDAAQFACAILYGNEDSPNRVELYKENDVRCQPVIYVSVAHPGGVYVLELGGPND